MNCKYFFSKQNMRMSLIGALGSQGLIIQMISAKAKSTISKPFFGMT